MLEVKINLFADFQEIFQNWARNNIASGVLGIKYVGRQKDKIEPWLQEASFGAVMEYLHQIIIPIPRNIHICKKFIASGENQRDVETILQIARDGGDLMQYLGSGIRKLDAPDALLNLWGIVHFHMKPHGKREAKNDNCLLFAYVTDKDFYVLGLGGHKDLYETRFIKILQSEFPEALAGYLVSEKPVVDIDSAEYEKLRKCNVNAIVSINGCSYCSPGGGVLSNGKSAKSYCEMAMPLRCRLDSASKDLEQWFLNGLEKLSSGRVAKIAINRVNLKLVKFQDDEILVSCPELGLIISYRDGTREMAIVYEKAENGE